MSLLLAVLLIIGHFYHWANTSINPQQQIEQRIIVKKGFHTESLLNEMKNKGIQISPVIYFKVLQRITNKTTIQSGDYIIKSRMTPWEILSKIHEGKVDPLKFQIIEGMTTKQILEKLKATKNIIHILPTQEQAAVSLDFNPYQEGQYLAATYHFMSGSTDLSILQQAHRAKVDALMKAWNQRDKINTHYQNPQDLLIMASIIEKEAGISTDRPLISSVFNNRLKKGMKLQTDPTVIYGIQNFDGNIRTKDLQTDTPYNTYTRFGLPPTPICSPGVASLMAAAQPAHTDYLYFVGKPDKSSAFAKTLAEHNANVSKYLLNKTQR